MTYRWIAALPFICMMVTGMQAQTLVGSSIGYEFGAPLSIERAPGRVNRYVSVDGFGTSSNHVAWLGAAIEWPDLIGSSVGLRARLRLATERGEFLSDAYVRDSVRSGPLTRTAVFRRFQVITATSGLLLDVGAAWHPFGRWSIHLGPWLGYRLASGVEEREWIESPGTASYEDGSRETAIASGDEISSTSLRGGFGLAVAWGFHMSDAIELLPELATRIDADGIARGLGLRAMTVGAGVSVMFHPLGERSGEGGPPERETPPSLLPPTVMLSLRGGDTVDTLVVGGASTIRRSIVPWPAFIATDSIPSIESAGESFELRDLAGREPEEIYDRIIDILGLRLRDDPSATVELAGIVRPGEPDSLGRRRAASLGAYLRRVWSVDSKRMALVVSRAEEGLPRAAVAIRSSSRMVTAPVEVSWIERRPTAPAITVDPVIRAEAGVLRWRLDLWFGRDAIGRYTGEGPALPRAVAPLIPLDRYRGAEALPAIVAEIQVIDSAGRLAEARAELPVRRARDARAGVDAERIDLLIVGGAAGGDSWEPMMERLAASLAEGSRVKIVREPAGDGAASDLPARLRSRIADEAARRGVTLAAIDVEEMARGAGAYRTGGSVRVIVEREMR